MSRLALSILASFLLGVSYANAQSVIQQNHVEANVPESFDFMPILKKDLLAYFKGGRAPSAVEVKVDLLRSGPTQSGVAYPKFYAWVTVSNQSQVVAEGAVRVAAIAKTRFEVTDFVPRDAARQDKAHLEAVFPQSLIQRIQQRAAR